MGCAFVHVFVLLIASLQCVTPYNVQNYIPVNFAYLCAEGCTTLQTESQDDLTGSKDATLSLKTQLEALENSISDMDPNTRSVLLVPAHQFFNVVVYNFMLRFALDRDKYIDNGGANKSIHDATVHRNGVLHEMLVHSKFMHIFVKHYIHPTYSETALLVEKRSDFFFRHHRAEYHNVPRGIFLRTCVQGALMKTHIPDRLLQGGIAPSFPCDDPPAPPVVDFTGKQEVLQRTDETHPPPAHPHQNMTRNIPPIVQPTMDSILHLVRIASSHLMLYLEICTHPWILEHVYPGMLPVPSVIEGHLSIRDILHELVYIINFHLCGRFQAGLAPHAYYTNCILETKILQESDVQFLFAILGDFEARIAGRIVDGDRLRE